MHAMFNPQRKHHLRKLNKGTPSSWGKLVTPQGHF